MLDEALALCAKRVLWKLEFFQLCGEEGLVLDCCFAFQTLPRNVPAVLRKLPLLLLWQTVVEVAEAQSCSLSLLPSETDTLGSHLWCMRSLGGGGRR